MFFSGLVSYQPRMKILLIYIYGGISNFQLYRLSELEIAY
ncbi:hypothetical protein FDUTEX481_06134 [Tolypothrix sp. PCC 7601]|nr:hypothetical protein FDUTEX481_06134 [Tolypothrix sp. PCC 7601]